MRGTLLGWILVVAAPVAFAQQPSLAGKWNWGAGNVIVEIDANGSGRDPRNTMKWTPRDPAARTYTLVWSHGYTDTVTLSADGKSLTGVNNTGMRFTSTRIAAAPASAPTPAPAPASAPASAAGIAGQWDWGAGGVVVDINADGTGKDPRNTMKWTLRDPAARAYTLSWSNGYTDTATLSADGNTITAVNNTGFRFSAKRRNVVPGAGLDLNGIWSGGLLHIWQDGTQVLVTASWKRDDGKYVIWRGEGNLNGRTVDLAIRYSPMTHGPQPEWRGVLTVGPDGNSMDAAYSINGVVRDKQWYTRQR